MQILLEHVSVVLNNKKILDNISFPILENEHWAIVGNSGSGKTTLAKSICKLIFHRGEITVNNENTEDVNFVFVEQQHQFKNKQNINLFYHQQRFNSFDTEETLSVAELLDINKDVPKNTWISFFGIEQLLEKPMIQLSNGENKRLQLTKALIQNPDVIVLDHPFVGLDTMGRILLQNALNQLALLGKKIIVVCNPKDIPACITHCAQLDKGKLVFSGPKDHFIDNINHSEQQSALSLRIPIIEMFQSAYTDFEKAVELKNVSIQYQHTKVLDKINWTIHKGEKWCLSGPNGSGKSTLLSLITADNPQAFANQIWLFDKKKGSGESIWDIKKKIGHVSPELHLFFEKDISVIAAVASGLYDTIGLFKQPSKEQVSIIADWMSLTGVDQFKDKLLFQLSLGEQRLVMLTRALVKSPPLLILDEPCQGLDETQTTHFKSIVDAICSIEGVTLIYVSHYQDDIPPSINHFLHLEKGQIKQERKTTF